MNYYVFSSHWNHYDGIWFRYARAGRIANWAQRVEKMTPEAKRRLKILNRHMQHGRNIARHFGLERKTVRRRRDRFKQAGA